jgi:polyisoprenoid-binding protein YceI
MRLVTASLAMWMALGASAAELKFDASNSELRFVGDYSGEPVPGVFKRFQGSLSLDVAQPTATRFRTVIDVASLDTDYADRDETLRGSEFFDATAFPEAIWTSVGDCSGNLAVLNCNGELTLKGQTRPVPIVVKISPDGKTVTGKAVVDRSAFGIGSGEWEDASTIRHDIEVTFVLRL